MKPTNSEMMDLIADGVAIVLHEVQKELTAELATLRTEVETLRARLDAGAIDSERLAELLRAELAEIQERQAHKPELKLVAIGGE